MGKPIVVKLADNVPITMKAKYADIFPGEHGPQLGFKGAIKGGAPDARIYMDAGGALRELEACGAIEGPPRNYDPENIPEKGLDLRMGTKVLTIVREKPAGSTKSHLKITLVNTSGSAPAAKPAAQPAQPSQQRQPAPAEQVAPANGNGNGNGHPEKGSTYKRITEFVLSDIKPLYENAGLPIDADVMSRCVQTLYIQAMEKAR